MHLLARNEINVRGRAMAPKKIGFRKKPAKKASKMSPKSAKKK
jgi:hypothetical protein